MRNCDYIRDSANRLWIVAGEVSSTHGNSKVFAHLVYEPSDCGDRILNGVRYKKVINQKENFIPRIVSDIVARYEPQKCFSDSYERLPTRWRSVADAIVGCGVPRASIGIFGSYLLGFETKKDIDFVVYGKRNRDLVFSQIKSLKSNSLAADISCEHVAYQASTKGIAFSSENSWQQMLANKWSSLQFADGILSTIRFVYEYGEEPRDLWRNAPIHEETIEGIVRDAWMSDFNPRQFTLRTHRGDFSVGTYFWIYQSCVRDGDFVRVRGLRRENNCLTLDDFGHSIHYL